MPTATFAPRLARPAGVLGRYPGFQLSWAGAPSYPPFKSLSATAGCAFATTFFSRRLRLSFTDLLSNSWARRGPVLPGLARPPEEDLSLGRYPDGEDSDDNAEDLHTNMTPTPGYENVTGSSSNVDDSAPQKGCGKSADGDGPSKCASVSAAIHLGWLAGLVVLARRRDGD